MIEAQLPGVERDPAEPLVCELLAERCGGAILRIADHCMPARSALHANLMRAACLELDLKPCTDIGDASQHPKTHDRNLAARIIGRHHDRLRHPMPLVQMIGPCPVVACDIPLHDRPIDL